MKKIILALLLSTGFALTAQTENTTMESRNEADQDRIQQEPPREAQTGVDQAVRQATINQQNNKNVISSEDRLESEVERSTGKPAENPAETNPKTVKPVRIADPPSNPGQR